MDSRTNTLEQVIFKASTNQIKIPKYQRPYSWETQQIDEFWDDLIQENPTFFIGPIIINIEHKDQDDGYVRLLTVNKDLLLLLFWLPLYVTHIKNLELTQEQIIFKEILLRMLMMMIMIKVLD